MCGGGGGGGGGSVCLCQCVQVCFLYLCMIRLHSVHLVLWAFTFCVEAFYAPYINFHSFIHSFIHDSSQTCSDNARIYNYTSNKFISGGAWRFVHLLVGSVVVTGKHRLSPPNLQNKNMNMHISWRKLYYLNLCVRYVRFLVRLATLYSYAKLYS